MPDVPQAHPTVIGAVTFAAKVLGLRARRGAHNLFNRPPLHTSDGSSSGKPLIDIARVKSPLWTAESLVERSLQLGKIQNLRIAAASLRNVVVPAGQVFSFWRQIGRASSRKGFVEGRELREGCMIPAVGGGLCQLSNALYEAALDSGCEIIERHAHSMVIAGSAAAAGKDATVAWNYVDLRFRPLQDIHIDVQLTATELVVQFLASSKMARVSSFTSAPQMRVLLNTIEHTCTDCEAQSCFRHRPPKSTPNASRSAYLLDEPWPEFIRYVEGNALAVDAVGVPMTHGRYAALAVFRKRSPITAALTALKRGAAMRSSKTVPERLRHQLLGSQEIARRYARKIPYEATHLVVAQSLLPYLWQSGALGGRSFDVLMTRLPLADLHLALDAAASRWPERNTFKEYRAPEWIVSAERKSLELAAKIITPHAWLARQYAGRSIRLDWQLPRTNAPRQPRSIVFPGPTVARKGAFELREVLKDTGLGLRIIGGELEDRNFWSGVNVRSPQGSDWIDEAAVVVQPALIEDNPRPLLRAISAGVPVICTEQCGVAGLAGVEIVKFGETAALREALFNLLGCTNSGMQL